MCVLLLYSNLGVESAAAEEGVQELAKATPGRVEGREEEASLTGALGGCGKKLSPSPIYGTWSCTLEAWWVVQGKNK